MKYRLFNMVFLFSVTFASYSQSQIDGPVFYPSNITTVDTIQISFVREFWAFDARKMGDSLAWANDTIIRYCCYYCPCINLTPSNAYDTLKIHPLPAGLYHLLYIAGYSSTNLDSACYFTNQQWNDTIDTFFIVSTLNSIELPTRYPFYVALLNFNKLKIVDDKTGELAISVYDALGRKFYNRQMSLQQKESAIDLELPELPHGIYFYAITINDKRKVLKFVKE